MISRVEGLVLRTVRYQDSGLVMSLYTREVGRLDVLIKGARSARGGRRHARLQPLALIEAVVYQRPGRDLQHLTESNLAHTWQHLDQHPVRSLYGMLVCELVSRAVREHEPNAPLYDFVKATLVALDEYPSGWYDVMAHFMVHLTRYLGFFPHSEGVGGDEPVQFHLEDGSFAPSTQADPVHQALLRIARAPEAEPVSLGLDGPQRRALLQLLLRYYPMHLEGFGAPRSLSVFEEMFS